MGYILIESARSLTAVVVEENKAISFARLSVVVGLATPSEQRNIVILLLILLGLRRGGRLGNRRGVNWGWGRRRLLTRPRDLLLSLSTAVEVGMAVTALAEAGLHAALELLGSGRVNSKLFQVQGTTEVEGVLWKCQQISRFLRFRY